MSEQIEQLIAAFRKADALAQQGDGPEHKRAAEDAKLFAQEIRRLSAAPEPARRGGNQNGPMGHLNRGVADFIDLINPFDTPHALNPFPEGTGSAADAMRAIGIPTADREPETFMEHVARGGGDAAAALIPGGLAAKKARAAGGVVGAVADDIYRGLTTKTGAAAEVAAGGLSAAAGHAAREAGAPEWIAQTAEFAAPVAGIPAIARAGRTAGKVADRLSSTPPVAGAVYRAAKGVGRDALRAAMPMTESGAREVARKRLVDAVGGTERAEMAGERITPDNPLNLTPAQQTADPDLMGLERAAAAESPALRDRLAARADASRVLAEQDIRRGEGPPDPLRKHFMRLRRQFSESIDRRIETALMMADESVEAVGPRSAQSTNSRDVVDALKAELDVQRGIEARLWAEIPRDVRIVPETAMARARGITDETVWAQREDIPRVVSRFIEIAGGGEAPGEQTVAELHGLYSKLREIARTARAGTSVQRNKARIADNIADGILEDLGAMDASTEVGRKINAARAHSAALHEKFDQGTVGRILNRTIDGDERIAPETALRKTVGLGREEALVASADIESAAPDTSRHIAESLRGFFIDSAIAPDGSYNPRAARRWLRKNREVLAQRYPGLLREMGAALKSRDAAARFAARSRVRSQFDDATPTGRIASGATEKAVPQVLLAQNPAREARLLRNAAERDASGESLAGLKGVFNDYLIGKAQTAEGLSGAELSALVSDPKIKAALRAIYTPEEVRGIDRIAGELAKLDTPTSTVGSVLESPAHRLIEMAVRIAFAKGAARMHSGNDAGVSLQIANMASGTGKRLMQNLTNDRARLLLLRAMEDPELLKTLLTENPLRISKNGNRVLSRYMLGAGAATASE